MFLKRLTLRGFKSFADRTVLDLEPGITVIVGPNGSGKSNIVDALTWVLGSHSAKSLRGGSMADVIFAGSGPVKTDSARPAMGRASVEITIDNGRGVLPIEFSEVTVGRGMFASGENAYTINEVDCRLLDVQELLSDTGLGRENHTIVGQGQLDAVLSARPEDRRALLEEAAGILKHRRRKERALRKLIALESHLERLDDIVGELRRQLRPLERQAQAAGKHAELSEALNGVRTIRAVRELSALTRREEAERATRERSDGRLTELEGRLRQLRRQEGEVEQALARIAPRAREAGEVHFRLANLTERARGLTERIEERRTALTEAVEEPFAGRDPGQLRARAGQERAGLGALASACDGARAHLAAAGDERLEAEQARRAHEQATATAARARAEARERLLRWEGQVAALSSALEQATGEQGRLADQITAMQARVTDLEREVAASEAEVIRLDEEAGAGTAAVEAARAALADRLDALRDCTETERELERRRAALDARVEALRADAPSGSADLSLLAGVLGPLTDHLKVEDGMAPAIAALLGPLGEATVAAGPAEAAAAIRLVAERQAEHVTVLAAADPIEDDAQEDLRSAALRDAGARRAGEQVVGDDRVVAALRPFLDGAWVVADLDTACKLAARHPDLQLATHNGELAGVRGYASGVGDGRGAVLRQAAANEAAREAIETVAALATVGGERSEAERERNEAAAALEAVERTLSNIRGARVGAAAGVQRSTSELAGAQRELTARRRQADTLVAQIGEQRARLEDLERRGPGAAARTDEEAEQRGDVEAERLDDALAGTREAETQARLALGAAEQHMAEAERRIAALEHEAVEVERGLVEREQRREARRAALDRCCVLAQVAATTLARGEASLNLGAAERDRLEEDRAARQRDLGALRARLRDLEAERESLVTDRHADELRRAELRQALDLVRARLTDELQQDPDAALASAEDGMLEGGEERDRELEAQEATLARQVALLGAVNPLALEEFTAVSERHRFLTDQLADVRSSRRDLEEVIAAVDQRIREVFSAAFTDVAAQFERLFPRLFPGGEGRLVLTDPEDLLESGIEVEARPAGKRVKRLSLLSGGERSLTALAVLFAIFAARPSPFYVLDEVEAALDDVNLLRFCDLLAEFSSSAQLLVVTHQKRTMEIADTLYGVTMRGGVSRVVTQRLRQGRGRPADHDPATEVVAARL